MSGDAGRILVLVDHEPEADPRVGWVTELCAGIARTDVIGTVAERDGRPVREFDGSIYVERVDPNALASVPVKAAAFGIGGLSRAARGRFDTVAATGYRGVAVSALRRRGRALSLAPRLIVCHDLPALVAGVALKRQYGAQLLYDAHEYWPQASMNAGPLHERAVRALEGRLVREADAVVTVSPQLGRHLERVYDLEGVLVVPNAVPYDPSLPRSREDADPPLRFLFQGHVSEARGVGTLIEGWADSVDPGVAVLVVRAPRSPYLEELERRFAAPIASGRIVVAPPVRENELVAAAAEADVGVIPYAGENLNHRFACPNKLSQYMHAGLAIFTSTSEYVSEVVERYDCGVRYEEAGGLGAAVASLAADPDRLVRLKRSARAAVEREFNWEAQSEPYRRELERLFTA